MSAIDHVGKQVQAAYRGAARAERLHVTGRLRSCPVAAVEAATPRAGRILDFGCGHGAVSLYLALSAPDRQITGVDVDGEKVVDARTAAKTAELDVEFDEVESDYLPVGEWDAIVIVDVLYLLGRSTAFAVLDAATQALAPGGVLVIKEIDTQPRWKYLLAAGQELVSTKVLRITEGSRVEFLEPAAIDERLRANGLSVEHHPCHRGRMHPHHLILARKPAS